MVSCIHALQLPQTLRRPVTSPDLTDVEFVISCLNLRDPLFLRESV